MANRNLTSDELKHTTELLMEIRKRLTKLAAGDRLLLFAYRRKIWKELQYDERGKPGARGKLKALKWGLQSRKCAQKWGGGGALKNKKFFNKKKERRSTRE